MMLFWGPNKKQSSKSFHDTIGRMYFVFPNGPDTERYFYYLILAYTRSEDNFALAVATSGVAALLLEGGRTAHSRFRLPLDATATSTCNTSIQSPLAQLLRSIRVILWDELFMAHRCIEPHIGRYCQCSRCTTG